MTETTLLERQQICEEFDEFIEDVEKNVREACAYLGWDFDSINDNKEEPHINCPFNEGHRVPVRTIEKHLQKCEWNTLGYTKECVPLPESILPSNAPSTIKFDMKLQHEVLLAAKEKDPELNIEVMSVIYTMESFFFLITIGTEEKFIPQTSDRLTSDFTSDERKAMYEYVIAHTVAPEIGQDIPDINKPEKSKEEQSSTILELLAQERNLKRRRAKHRGVHTNKKSHTEILREIVEQQMEMYREYISEKYDIPNPDVDKNSSCDNNNEDENIEESSVTNSKQEYQNKSNECEEDENYDQHVNNSRNHDEKSEKNSRHNRDHSGTRKHSNYREHNYQSSSWDQNSRDYPRKHKYYEKDRDKHHSRERNYENGDSRERNRDKNDSSRDRNQDKSDSSRDRNREKRDSSCDRSRDKSDSSRDKNRDRKDSSHDRNRDKSDSSRDKNRDRKDSSHDRNRDKSDSSRDKNRDKRGSSYDRSRDKSDSSRDKNRERNRDKNDSRDRYHDKSDFRDRRR